MYRLILICLSFYLPSLAIASNGPSVVDTVIASVDGSPILLSDVRGRLQGAHKASLEELVQREEWRARVDELILERVLAAEANARRISVSDDEVQRYIEEVAQRNGLSVEDLKREISKEYPSQDAYLVRVKSEILKSKLVGQFIQGGVSVSDSEVDEALTHFLAKRPSDHTVSRLRQIVIAKDRTDGRDPDSLLAEVQSALESGDDFEDVAREYSEGPAAAEGGFIGELNESSLEPALATAVAKVAPGERTAPIETGIGYHIVLVEERRTDATTNAPSREEVRKALEARKLEERIAQFLREDLFREHTIERRL